MCMMVYIASDIPLPLIPWSKDKPAFHVQELTQRDAAVRRQFSKPNVYYVGAHEGCGCGFQHPEFDVDAEAQSQTTESRRRLGEYLRQALSQQQSIELFACWDGDQAKRPEYRDAVRLDEWLQSRSHFREKELLVISR